MDSHYPNHIAQSMCWKKGPNHPDILKNTKRPQNLLAARPNNSTATTPLVKWARVDFALETTKGTCPEEGWTQTTWDLAVVRTETGN